VNKTRFFCALNSKAESRGAQTNECEFTAGVVEKTNHCFVTKMPKTMRVICLLSLGNGNILAHDFYVSKEHV